MCVCNPASRESWLSHKVTGEPLNSRSQIFSPYWREITVLLSDRCSPSSCVTQMSPRHSSFTSLFLLFRVPKFQVATVVLVLVLVSIRPSVCYTFSTIFLSLYDEIFRSYKHWQKWCQCKRSRSSNKVTKVKTNCAPIWAFPDSIFSLYWQVAAKREFTDWLRNDVQSLKQCRRGSLLFFGVIRKISRSLGKKKKTNFDLNWAFPDCKSSLNSLMAVKWSSKLWISIEEVMSWFSRPSGPVANWKVTRNKKKSWIFTQTGLFQTVTPVCFDQWLWNDTQS